MIIDEYNRTFKNLRISLLDSCNFACIYCTDEDGLSSSKKSNLDFENLIKTVKKIHEKLNLQSIRLTGGEPLLYPNLIPLITELSKLKGINIKMTSNAFLLAIKAKALKQAGLEEINISLDAIEDAVFFKMTRRDKLQEVLKGIDAALECGLKVKLNTVVMKNKNHHQILPLLAYAHQKNISIRFLEVMAMGHLHQQQGQHLFRQQDILNLIATEYQFDALPRKKSATANYWETKQGLAFGIIANSSEPFCRDCDRLRLDHHGNIYGCLSINEPISIKNIYSDEELNVCVKQALNQKQPVKFTGSKLSMLNIGG